MPEYIHGYTTKEQERLLTQNQHLSPFIYKNIDFKGVQRLLEVGCGVGAQMIKILQQYDEIHVTGVDVSQDQIAKAQVNLSAAHIDPSRYQLLHTADFDPKVENDFDGLLMIWVLEHVEDPIDLLTNYRQVLKKGAVVSITEVFNSSMVIYPQKPSISKLWNLIQKLQSSTGGDGDAGIHLPRYLREAGYIAVERIPNPLVVDQFSPDNLKVRHFDYWKELMLSSEDILLEKQLISKSEFSDFIKEMDEARDDPSGFFSYTIMQAKATV